MQVKKTNCVPDRKYSSKKNTCRNSSTREEDQALLCNREYY